MANYHVRWLNHRKTVILLEYSSGWTWQDTFEGTEAARDLVLTVSHEVYAVVHFINSTYIPIDSSMGIKRVIMYYPPNTIGIIVIAANPLLASTIQQQLRQNNDTMPYDFVSTLENALDLLPTRNVDLD